jgi:hypothetical protein
VPSPASRTAAAHRALAVKELVAQAPELTDEQQADRVASNVLLDGGSSPLET